MQLSFLVNTMLTAYLFFMFFQFDELTKPVAQEVEFIFIRLNVLREVQCLHVLCQCQRLFNVSNDYNVIGNQFDS